MSTGRVVVPDASVILKWVLPGDVEPDTERALELRDAITDERLRVFVPQLWLFEVGNILARRFPNHAADWLSALMKFGLEEVAPSPAWIKRILELTSQFEVTFYDAAYHGLAILCGGVFVTADRKYVSKVKERGSIAILSEWQLPKRAKARKE